MSTRWFVQLSNFPGKSEERTSPLHVSGNLCARISVDDDEKCASTSEFNIRCRAISVDAAALSPNSECWLLLLVVVDDSRRLQQHKVHQYKPLFSISV